VQQTVYIYIRCNRRCRFLDLSLMGLRTSCFLCGTSCCRSCAAGGLWCAHPCHIGSTTRARYRRICTGASLGLAHAASALGPIRMGGSALWYSQAGAEHTVLWTVENQSTYRFMYIGCAHRQRLSVATNPHCFGSTSWQHGTPCCGPHAAVIGRSAAFGRADRSAARVACVRVATSAVALSRSVRAHVAPPRTTSQHGVWCDQLYGDWTLNRQH
jgi:hypothetical protein